MAETEQQADARRTREAIDKRKVRLKKAAQNSNDAALLLTQAIINVSGNTKDDLENTIALFETGGVTLTPDANDTPYNLPYTDRPKVVIIAENLPLKRDITPKK